MVIFPDDDNDPEFIVDEDDERNFCACGNELETDDEILGMQCDECYFGRMHGL